MLRLLLGLGFGVMRTRPSHRDAPRALLLPLVFLLTVQPAFAGVCDLLCASRNPSGSASAGSKSGCPAHRHGPRSVPPGERGGCPGHQGTQGALLTSAKYFSGSSALGWLGIFTLPDTTSNPLLSILPRRFSERPLPSPFLSKSTILRL